MSEQPPFLVGVTEDFPGGNDDDLVQWAFEAGTAWQKWRDDHELLDDATVERAARALYSQFNLGGDWDKHADAAKGIYRKRARAVLAAALKEDGE